MTPVVIRRPVKAASDMIFRRVRVDRTRTPQAVLDATRRKQYTDRDVVANMPGRGDGIEELDVYFFTLNRSASDEAVEEAYKLHGLKGPADPYALAQANADDPLFANTHPNNTHWKGADGGWCYAAFYRWNDVHEVSVRRKAIGWDSDWWFAGLRK